MGSLTHKGHNNRICNVLMTLLRLQGTIKLAVLKYVFIIDYYIFDIFGEAIHHLRDNSRGAPQLQKSYTEIPIQ